MPKVRDLKKDIKQMVKHFLNECYTQLTFTPSLNQEYILDIISDVLQLQEEVIARINRGKYQRETVKSVEYQEVANTFYSKIVELTERLHSLDY